MSPIPVVPADPNDVEVLERVCGHLEDGGLLGYPTETVYGLGAAATADGVSAVRALKGREEYKPFLVLLPEGEGLRGERESSGDGLSWSPEARALAEAFWPGPLTLVLADPDSGYPEGVRSRAGGVAVRRSSHPFARALLARWGKPLLSTSVNRVGEAPARTVSALRRTVEGRPGVDRVWIADAGDLPMSEVSTVVDCTVPGGRVIRRGEISAADLRRIVPEVDDGR